MPIAGFMASDAVERAVREPLGIVQRALESEAPYFVDYIISQELQSSYPQRAPWTSTRRSTSTCSGSRRRAARRDHAARRDPGLAEAAAAGGADRRRSALEKCWRSSGPVLQPVASNRAVSARRQPGSVFKPFVYLAAFEHAQAEGRTDLTPATVVLDEPTSFVFNAQTWTPRNYEGPA